MTTTTGGIASGFGGFAPKKISENDTIFSKSPEDDELVKKPSPKEKPALHVDKKPIKGSKVLIVGHRERFLNELNKFLNDNLSEEDLKSGMADMPGSYSSNEQETSGSYSSNEQNKQTTATKMNPSSLNSTNISSIQDPQVQAAAARAKQSTLNAIEAEKKQIDALDKAKLYSDEALKNKKLANQDLQKMNTFDLLDTIGKIQDSSAPQEQQQQGNK